MKHLSSVELLNRTRALAAEERRVTLQLIEHLKEIDSRMLYAELGFESLFAFVVRHLGFSEGSAHRRISAMRLFKDVPELREKLESGALTLTNAAKIQVALRAAGKARLGSRGDSGSHLQVIEQGDLNARSGDLLKAGIALKTEIIEACSNLSQSECDQVLFQKIPGLSEQLPSERVRKVDTDKSEIKFVVTEALLQKVQKLNLMISHSNPEQKILNLFERLVDQELDRQEKKRSMKVKPVSSSRKSDPSPQFTTNQTEKAFPVPSKSVARPTVGRIRSLPAQVRRLVFERAKSKCEFSGCNSTYQLQIDHCLPWALGGSHAPENLRVLCRVHNIREARRLFGDEKMDSFSKRGLRGRLGS